MILRSVAAIGLGSLLVLALAACQSTQEKSAELAKKGSTKLKQEKGLTISKESSEVKVTGTTVLTDQNGSAVVVDLKNDSSKGLANVPILVDVQSAKGKSVYRNDFPGLDPSLTSLGMIEPGGEAQWVNDQVFATAPPKSVKVKVGESTEPIPSDLWKFDLTQPKLEKDPVSGIEATGTVTNRSGKDQDQLLLFAVATKGGRVVAAGRGALNHIKAKAKPLHYHIFFIGNPKGAQVKVTPFPTIPPA